MTYKLITINARPYNVTQFESVSEALKALPEHLILQYINASWNNTQRIKLIEAHRKGMNDYQSVCQDGR